MYSISGLRKYIAVLVVQDAVLFLLSALGFYVLLFGYADGSRVGALLSANIFLAALFVCAILFFAWRILAGITEGLWSIRAEGRVRNLLMLSLRAGVVFSIAGLLWIWGVRTFGGGELSSTFSLLILSIFLLFAAALPCAVSSVLTAGIIKHFIGVRKMSADMIQSIAGKGDALERINVSILSGAGSVSTSARPNPKGFYVAGLTSKPWFESEEFPWVKNFEDNFEEILNEAKTVLGSSLENLDHYFYPGIDTDRWRIFSFVADRKERPENLAKCPATAKALKSIPGYPFFRDAMFSILEPGGVIKPHRDDSNLFVTMHFGLITPEGGFMEAAGFRRPWRAGKAIFFDSSYEHQAVNASDGARVVLLADFLNPGITPEEREWIVSAPLWRE